MAKKFHELVEKDPLYRIKITYHDNGLISVDKEELIMATHIRIFFERAQFLCFEKNTNAKIAFSVHNCDTDKNFAIVNDEFKRPTRYVTTSKKFWNEYYDYFIKKMEKENPNTIMTNVRLEDKNDEQ